MSRNFSDFVDSYLHYAEDGFCPSEFHQWTAYTLIAAALERKVWIEQGSVFHYPNIYSLLVGYPGSGKSTALNKGMELFEAIREQGNPDLKIIPNQITESALVEIMKTKAVVRINNIDRFHSSALFYASEASSSALKNTYGDFYATITDLYDCPRIFRKKLKGDPELKIITNACVNVLTGTTFDFLKRIVNEESVMGGLASRFIYVISKTRTIRESKWDKRKSNNWTAKTKLCEDLLHINKLAGKFNPTEEYIARWEAWQPDFDKYLIALNSPRMESLMARKTTHIIKLSMILSISKSDNMILTADHWDEALEEINKVTDENAFVVSSAVIGDRASQIGLSQLVGTAIKNCGGTMPLPELKAKIIANGNNLSMVKETLVYMSEAHIIKVDYKNDVAYLLKDPSTYL